MSAALDTAELAVVVGRALEQAQVEYALGGSVATSLQGEPRSTNDIDFAVRLDASQVPPLVAALGPDFDVDEPSLLEAIRLGRSANIFHVPSTTKIDLFIRGADPFDNSELARRIKVAVPPGTQTLYLASPEDNLLRKLHWFRLGGEVSDRQWRDILGLLRTADRVVDLDYLRRWAAHLSVSDLLDRCLAQKDGGQT